MEIRPFATTACRRRVNAALYFESVLRALIRGMVERSGPGITKGAPRCTAFSPIIGTLGSSDGEGSIFFSTRILPFFRSLTRLAASSMSLFSSAWANSLEKPSRVMVSCSTARYLSFDFFVFRMDSHPLPISLKAMRHCVLERGAFEYGIREPVDWNKRISASAPSRSNAAIFFLSEIRFTSAPFDIKNSAISVLPSSSAISSGVFPSRLSVEGAGLIGTPCCSTRWVTLPRSPALSLLLGRTVRLRLQKP